MCALHVVCMVLDYAEGTINTGGNSTGWYMLLEKFISCLWHSISYVFLKIDNFYVPVYW